MGYTGQRADSATGLDYYHARYYDPVAGQFVSADTMQDGLNRYGYVRGNPTTATDPSGHRRMCDHDCWAPSPPKHKTPPPEDCRATHTCKGDGGGKKGDGEDECQRTNTCSSQSSGDSAIKQECVSICRAQEIAGDESGFFSTLGFHLTLAAIAIEASGALLDVIGAFFPLAAPVTVSIGVFVGAIGGIIGVLAADAYWLSSKFSWNSGWSVASGRWDSRSALEAMRQEINDTLNTEIAVLGGLGGKSALEVVTDAAQWILDQNGIVPFIPPWGRIVASDVLANAAYLWMSLDIMLDANMAIDSEESALGV